MHPSEIIKNFRDVGESIEILLGRPVFPQGLLYRGGRINSVFDHEKLLNIPTILNLRTGKDEQLFPCHYLHIPAKDKVENYTTSNRKVRVWVNQVISTICEPSTALPIYIHCTSGKDRTGVIVAAILASFGLSPSLIAQEYLLSDGADSAAPIKRALEGFGDISTYLKNGIAEKIVEKLKSP